jgi:hypothetical protein
MPEGESKAEGNKRKWERDGERDWEREKGDLEHNPEDEEGVAAQE